jgi:hypothetical protein
VTYQGESRMLDSLQGICPGQAGLEYPATSVPFSNRSLCSRLVAVLSARSAGMSHPPLSGRETAITTIAHAEPIRVTVGVDTHGDVHVA